MKSYRTEIKRSWVRREPSARALADLLQMNTPVTLRDLVWRMQQVESVTVEKDIHTDDDVAINGHAKMVLRSNGDFEFSGHVRATGFTSHLFSVIATVGTGEGGVISAHARGRVFGKDTPGDRQRNWHQPGNNAGIIDSWRGLRDGPGIRVNFDAELSGVLGGVVDVFEFVGKGIVANIFLGPYGWHVLVGAELMGLSDALSSPNILAGILVAGGVFLILGPFGLVPAIIAGVVTAAVTDIKHRPLEDREKNWARNILGDHIPYDMITITNMLHPNGSKFATPGLGGRIYLNLGDQPGLFDDPTEWSDPLIPDYSAKGSLFVHELMHAWQIHNYSLPKVISDLSSNYNYESDPNWDTRSWSSFNNEQQAHIVDDWYGRTVGQTNPLLPVRDRAYRFMRDHVWTGHD